MKEMEGLYEPLIFELSGEGKKAFEIKDEFEEGELGIPGELLREDLENFPEVSEREVVRHYVRISQLNYCVDKGLYPLGSCTMKYNPKVNEKVASLEGFTEAHPCLPEELVQGNLKIFRQLEQLLKKLTGLKAFTLAPAAGAHGELTGIMIIRRYLESKGQARKVVLIPDSAHGTNPASATFAGYHVKEIPSNERGTLDLEKFKEALNEDVAALMITNPNTLGIFESDIVEIAELLHKNGSFLYMDGANMNAFLGKVRVSDLGVDVLHLNLHKTFSTPHGGGGPGSGPVGVSEKLVNFLPYPRLVERDGKLYWEMGGVRDFRVRTFYANFLVLIKALAYILELGEEGLRRVSEIAVLNASYLRKKLEAKYILKYKSPTMHEFVLSDATIKKHGVSTMDVAKRLLDYGFHPPTVYFPLIVPGAMMIEPTETESKRDLDMFAEAMLKIAEEAEKNPELLHSAPHHTPVRRLDEVLAARKPVLRWTPELSRREGES